MAREVRARPIGDRQAELRAAAGPLGVRGAGRNIGRPPLITRADRPVWTGSRGVPQYAAAVGCSSV